MRKKEQEYVIISILICIGFSFLTYFLWNFFSWNSLFIVLPCVIILEFFFLQWIDKKHAMEERLRLIQGGIISAIDFQVSTSGEGDEFDQLRNFIRLNLNDLNELLKSFEEAYRETITLLDQAEFDEAKLRFESVRKDIQEKFSSIDEEVENFFKETPISNDKDQQRLFNSYKEHYDSEKEIKKEQIEEIIKKFEVRSEFSVHLEDILQFEIENEREISDSDINDMKFPYQPAKQLIKVLEKPVKLKIGELSTEDKQKFGALGRKIIEQCSQEDVTPNLPFLIIKLGMTLQEAKKILTYLQSVGIIETVYYHYVKKENQPR